MLESGIDLADELFHLTGIVIALSIVAHSSTDLLVARQFRDHRPPAGDQSPTQVAPSGE